MQIDNPVRGFSYKKEAFLDMRMDMSKTMTAADYLSTVSVKNLTICFMKNADFEDGIAYRLAKGIVNSTPALNTTMSLANKVREIILDNNSPLPVQSKTEIDGIIARVMQSIRIEVNNEFEVLDQLLAALPKILKKDARVVILTFHSGEDRRVKKSLKEGFKTGLYSEWGRDVVIASQLERRRNPRSKCCKLRFATKA